ncbi:MAG: tRNA-dihydrouridine synthase family protein [Lachnospiraceae bacterium]|nr:tRNA-dihydrouridine synthase family protein [Lachnospiraceae bacterium]
MIKKLYMAPMEGVTGHIFRRAYHMHINGTMDKYFTPFLSPNQNQCMTNRERKDILPQNNPGMPVVPQILTKDAVRFVDTAKELYEYGYREVNLNLGCPSGTVVAKKKGAGMLSDLAFLERFLDEIYEKCPMPISIKTRLGIEKEEEWEPLFQLFCKYPVKELIVHARLLADFYTGPVRVDCFERACKEAPFPMVYNGDIFTVKDAEIIKADTLMLGRGILRNPMLSLEIQGRKGGSLRAFHEQLLQDYAQEMSGETPTLHKMKELWSHLILAYPDAKKEYKAIRKSKSIAEYVIAVDRIL